MKLSYSGVSCEITFQYKVIVNFIQVTKKTPMHKSVTGSISLDDTFDILLCLLMHFFIVIDLISDKLK